MSRPTFGFHPLRVFWEIAMRRLRLTLPAIQRCLPALMVAAVLALSALAPLPSPALAKHCSGYGYSYGYGHCK